MCDFTVSRAELLASFDASPARTEALFQHAMAEFGSMLTLTSAGLTIPERARPLTRMVARAFDAYDTAEARHSSAV